MHFWVENCFLRIELRERTGARAAALERMRLLYAYIRARMHARARVIASGHDVTSTCTYLVGESPTGDARAFCATYVGGERLAPCRA